MTRRRRMTRTRQRTSRKHISGAESQELSVRTRTRMNNLVPMKQRRRERERGHGRTWASITPTMWRPVANWNPNKGPYHRESKEKEEAAQEDMPKLGNKEQASSSSTSSSRPLTFWDADGIWHEYGGDWWKEREDGWWEKWKGPSQ